MTSSHENRLAQPALLTELISRISQGTLNAKAVHAVLDLHYPHEQRSVDSPLSVTLVCCACSDNDDIPWPCRTIRALMTVYEVTGA